MENTEFGEEKKKEFGKK